MKKTKIYFEPNASRFAKRSLEFAILSMYVFVLYRYILQTSRLSEWADRVSLTHYLNKAVNQEEICHINTQLTIHV